MFGNYLVKCASRVVGCTTLLSLSCTTLPDPKQPLPANSIPIATIQHDPTLTTEEPIGQSVSVDYTLA